MSLHSRLLRASALLLLAALGVAGVNAQTFGRLDELEARGASFVYARPGEPTIRVSVTGDVRAPGLYEVNETIDLAELMAFAGGPTQPPEQNEIAQRTVVRLLRGAERAVIYEGEWVDLQALNSIAIADGDLVSVRLFTRRITTWRDNIPLLSLGVSAGVALLQMITLLTR